LSAFPFFEDKLKAGSFTFFFKKTTFICIFYFVS
jgi:hypothetical protein